MAKKPTVPVFQVSIDGAQDVSYPIDVRTYGACDGDDYFHVVQRDDAVLVHRAQAAALRDAIDAWLKK